MQREPSENTHRVLVIGGRGFLGRLTVAALDALPAIEVFVGTRQPTRADDDSVTSTEIGLDLRDPETFAALDRFHAVVNCADVLHASPVAASAYCRERGILFVESTADADAIESLLIEHGGGLDGPGAVLVGVGLFPGLSNLLATRVAERAQTEGGSQDAPIRIEIAIDPFSGAGPGTIGLMAKVAGDADVRMPETVVMAHSRGAQKVEVALVPGMRWARPMARLAGRMLPRNRFVRGVLAFVTKAIMVPLRRLVFRKRSGRITIVAQCAEERIEARTKRGFEATAEAIAATTALCLQAPPEPGCHALEQVLDASSVVAEMRSVPGCDVVIEPALSGASEG